MLLEQARHRNVRIEAGDMQGVASSFDLDRA